MYKLFFKTTWAVLNVCILFRKAKSVKCLIYFLCIHAVYTSFQPKTYNDVTMNVSCDLVKNSKTCLIISAFWKLKLYNSIYS